jgi:hypothetical protein
MPYTDSLNNVDFEIDRILKEKASIPHEKKMLQLVDGDEDRRGELAGVLPSGLEKPYHMMYKLQSLISLDGHRVYEFLVEYCLNKPSEGIYYGCRGFTNLTYDHTIERAQFEKDFELLRPELIRQLNNHFIGKDFSKRLLGTDNAHCNTFWLFWISLQPEEDIKEVALVATRIIKGVFAQYLGVKDTEPSVNELVKNDYNELLDKCVMKGGYDNTETFKQIIQHLEDDGILKRDKVGKFIWIGTKSHHKQADFSRLMVVIFNLFIHPGKGDKYVPWKTLRKIFLRHDGKYFPAHISTQRSHLSKDVYDDKFKNVDDKDKFTKDPKFIYWIDKLNSYHLEHSKI